MQGQGMAWREHGTAQVKHNDGKRKGLLWNGRRGCQGIETVHGLAGWVDGWLRYEREIRGRFFSTIIGLQTH